MSTHRVTNPKFENLGGVKQSKKQLSSGHLAAAVICQARVIHCRVLLKTEGGGVMSAKTRHCAVADCRALRGEIKFCPTELRHESPGRNLVFEGCDSD